MANGALDVAHHPALLSTTVPNYVIKPLQLPIHNMPSAFAGWAVTEQKLTKKKVDMSGYLHARVQSLDKMDLVR